MNTVALPALRSDDALGFLAALGVLELLTTVEGLDVRLAWEGVGGEARLWVDLPDADAAAVAERLRSIAARLRSEGRLAPADASLVLARVSQTERSARKAAGIEEKNDPMKAPPGVMRDRLLNVADLERGGDRATARWAAGLMTMLAVDRAGMALLTPLYAPVGQQVLAQLLGLYLMQASEGDAMYEALVAWRRRPDAGANLDHRALRDGAWTARGDADNAAVPGATWLALMATPLFRQVGNGRRGEAVGWRRPPRSVRPRQLVWPVWTQPRSLAAVEALLSHPEVRTEAPAGAALSALGVVALCSASRVPLGNADGPLQAAQVFWP